MMGDREPSPVDGAGDRSLDAILRTFVDRMPQPPERVDDEAPIQSALHLDSLDFLALVTEIERRLGVAIPEVDYPLVSTLGGLRSYLVAHSG